MASIDISKTYAFQFPPGIVSWKGRTLYQVVGRLRRITNNNSNVALYFLPPPVTKWYRREITSWDNTSCHSRLSYSLRDALEIPGGSLTTSSLDIASLANGLIGVQDPLFPNNQGELGNACNQCNNNTDNCQSSQTSPDNVCFRPDVNARRRCRSAGMIPRKFIGNSRAYFTDNKQYLHSRNRTVQQNEYTYIRQGNAVLKPGMTTTQSNVYSANGLSHCVTYKISAKLGNNQIQYIWLDHSISLVTFPDGNYNIFDFDNFLTNQQLANTHYYKDPSNDVKTVLLHIGFNNALGVPTVEVRDYHDMTGKIPGGSWTLSQNTPQLVILSNSIGPRGLGMVAGTYPMTVTSSQVLMGGKGSMMSPAYVPLYYKPSNPQYATQGGVSSSARLLRTKYNEIQKAAVQTNILGQAMANSLAYDVPLPDYPTHIKAKMGYPLTATPVISENNVIKKCNKFIYR